MTIIFCTQYYVCSTPSRQQEIDHCLHLNLHNPQFDRAVIWLEGAAALPVSSSIPLEIVRLDRRLTYADWLQLVQRQPRQALVLLANSDISFDASLAALPAWLRHPRAALALSRHEAGLKGAVLRSDPHWSQDVWALRGDSPIDASLLSASAIPLGVPGCDNRFAHGLWSHGFDLANPCFQIRALHHQQQGPNAYDRVGERLFGACTYVHPCLAQGETAELEHALWSRSPESSGLITLQLEGDQLAAERYRRQPPVGSGSDSPRQYLAELLPRGRPLSSLELAARGPLADPDDEHGPTVALSLQADRLALPMETMARGGLRLALRSPVPLMVMAVRLPPDLVGRRLLIESREADCAWRRWRSHQADPDAREHLPTLQLLHPPGDGPIQELRLRWSIDADSGEAVGLGRQSVSDALVELILVASGDKRDAPDSGAPPSSTEAGSLRAGQPVLPSSERLPFNPGLLLPHLPETRQGVLTWDPGDPTEELAWRQHAFEGGGWLDGNPCEAYLGLPWSTFAARGRVPRQLIANCGQQHRTLASWLAAAGRCLRVHSVCQHRGWRDQLPLFESAGVTDLWLSHKPPGLNQIAGLSLHPWPSLLPADPLLGAEASALICRAGSDGFPEAFWRALASARDVVLQAPWPELPALPPSLPAGVRGWSDVLFVSPDDDPAGLAGWLSAIPEQERRRRAALAQELFGCFRRLRCFPVSPAIHAEHLSGHPVQGQARP